MPCASPAASRAAALHRRGARPSPPAARSNGGGALTLYSGQHEQTTALLVHGFEKQTGIKVKVRSDDEATLANQILQEGSQLAGRRLLHREHAGARSARREGLLAHVDAVRPSRRSPRAYSSPGGDWVGVSARVIGARLQHRPARSRELPNSILDLAKPEWKGKLGFAPSETDFQPLVTAIIKLDGEAAAEQWLEGLKANAQDLRRQRDGRRAVNNGQSALGLDQPLLLVPAARRARRPAHALGAALLRPARPGRPARRLGRRRC